MTWIECSFLIAILVLWVLSRSTVLYLVELVEEYLFVMFVCEIEQVVHQVDSFEYDASKRVRRLRGFAANSISCVRVFFFSEARGRKVQEVEKKPRA
jgi:hypothetical protein